MGRSAAATMAALVVAVTIVMSAMGGTEGAVYMSVKNRLPETVRMSCWSNLQQTRGAVDLRPGGSFGFDVARAGIDHDSTWTCNFAGPDAYSGAFVLWRDRAGPCYSPSACPWVVDDYGLSLTRYDGFVEHVYRWP